MADKMMHGCYCCYFNEELVMWMFCGDQVDEYMEQLDNNKIPKLSSVGRKYHDTQVVVQLPRQDLSADCCRHLKTDSQQTSFDEFCRSRNTDALGIGRVIASTPNTTVRVHVFACCL